MMLYQRGILMRRCLDRKGCEVRCFLRAYTSKQVYTAKFRHFSQLTLWSDRLASNRTKCCSTQVLGRLVVSYLCVAFYFIFLWLLHVYILNINEPISRNQSMTSRVAVFEVFYVEPALLASFVLVSSAMRYPEGTQVTACQRKWDVIAATTLSAILVAVSRAFSIWGYTSLPTLLLSMVLVVRRSLPHGVSLCCCRSCFHKTEEEFDSAGLGWF